MAKYEEHDSGTRDTSRYRGDAFRALADPSRRRILRLLADRSLSAGEIAEHFDFTKPTLSRHLKVLREAELIVGEREGTSIRYSANLSAVEDVLIGLMNGLGLGNRPSADEATTADRPEHGAGAADAEKPRG
jgi:DNA-binding transcriptional ArsR family regulator